MKDIIVLKGQIIYAESPDKVGRFPLAGNGKSIITNDAAGMVKIVSDE